MSITPENTAEAVILPGGPDIKEKNWAERYKHRVKFPPFKVGDVLEHSHGDSVGMVVSIRGDDKTREAYVMDITFGSQYVRCDTENYHPPGSKYDTRLGKWIPPGYGLGALGLELIPAKSDEAAKESAKEVAKEIAAAPDERSPSTAPTPAAKK